MDDRTADCELAIRRWQERHRSPHQSEPRSLEKVDPGIQKYDCEFVRLIPRLLAGVGPVQQWRSTMLGGFKLGAKRLRFCELIWKPNDFSRDRSCRTSPIPTTHAA